jgi:RHS repeat-associated protein
MSMLKRLLLLVGALMISTGVVAQAPGAVGNLVVPNPLVHASFSTSWQAPASGGAPTRYEFEREQEGVWYSLSTAVSGTTFAHTESLQTGAYRFRVRACNLAGCGTYATSASIQALGPVLTGGEVSCASDQYCVKLRGTNITVPASLYTYVGLRKLDGTGLTNISQGAGLTVGSDAQGQYLQFLIPPALQSAFVVEGLKFYVVNHGQLMFSTPLVLQGSPVTALPPGSVGLIQLPNPIVHAQFSLSWSTPSSGGMVSRYELDRQQGGVWTALSASLTGTSFSHVDSLQTDSYRFRVRGCNLNGCGPYSTSALVPAAGPVLTSGEGICATDGFCVKLRGTNITVPTSLYTYVGIRKLDDSGLTNISQGAGLTTGSDVGGQFLQFQVPSALQSSFVSEGLKFYIVNHGQLLFSAPLVIKKVATVTILATPNSNLVAPATISLSSTVSTSASVSGVQFQQANGALICNGVLVGSTYACSWSGVAAGNYIVRARATVNGSLFDSLDLTLSVTSAPATVSISASPSIGLTAPASTTLTATVSTGTGLTGVVFQQTSGTQICIGALVSGTTFGCTWSSIAAGNYSIRARATVNGQTYDSASLAVSVAAPPATISATRTYVYDTNQRLCKINNPESGATLIDYDAAGNIAWTVEGSALTGNVCDRASVPIGSRIVRQYDSMNRVLGIDYPGTTADINNTYEADGALSTVASAGTTWTYHYNKRRMLDGESLQVDGNTYPIAYSFNANGHLASLSYPDGAQVSYAPNALGQPKQVSGYATGISYYPNGAIKQFSYGNGIVHTMTQNMRQLPARSQSVKSGVVKLDDSYTFDAGGNVTDITDQAETGTTTRGMSYDGLDRLRVAVAPGLWGTASYTYDALDNLRNADQGTRQYRYVYDTQQRLSQIKNPAGVSQITLGYNVAGDVTNKNTQAYTFDAAHRLLSVPGVADYVYDGHGRRVKETKLSKKGSPAEIGVYNKAGQKLFSKKDATTSTRNIYLAGSLIASTDTINGAAAPAIYLHTDALGSVVANSDSTGMILNRYRYAPYGESLNLAFGKYMDGLGYTGHEMDQDTGLTYMQQRYYDPGLGRFLSTDPLDGAGNRYWYADANPYKFTDPDGRQSAADRFGDAFAKDPKAFEAFEPLAIGVTAIMLAPLAIEVGMTAMGSVAANELTVVAMEVAAGDALGGASLATTATVAVKTLVEVAQTTGAAAGSKVTALITAAGDLYTGASKNAGGPGRATNEVVQAALDSLSSAERSRYHGCCGEINAMSNALNAGANLDGAVMATATAAGRGAGEIAEACPSCAAVAEKLAVETVSPQ